MDSNFWNGTAIVTEAGSDLGGSLIDRFASEGMAIVALDSDASRAEDRAGTVQAKGGQAIGFGIDLLNRRALHEVAEGIVRRFKNCTVLCASAGLIKPGKACQYPKHSQNFALDAQSIALINIIAEFLPLLRLTKGNRRVLITAQPAQTRSIDDIKVNTDQFSLSGLGDTLRLALEPESIGVSILFPNTPDPYNHAYILAARPQPRNFAPKASVQDPIAVRLLQMATECLRAPPDYSENLLNKLASNANYIFGL